MTTFRSHFLVLKMSCIHFLLCCVNIFWLYPFISKRNRVINQKYLPPVGNLNSVQFFSVRLLFVLQSFASNGLVNQQTFSICENLLWCRSAELTDWYYSKPVTNYNQLKKDICSNNSYLSNKWLVNVPLASQLEKVVCTEWNKINYNTFFLLFEDENKKIGKLTQTNRWWAFYH